jgi:hypothetical protein
MKFCMTKRLPFFIALLLLCSLTLSSCLALVLAAKKKEAGSDSINDKQLARFKSQTAVLVLPASEYPYIEDYKQLIPTAWTLTPIEVIKYSDLGKYTDLTKYAIFNIQRLLISHNDSYGQTKYTNTHYYLTLSSFLDNGKGKKKPKTDDFGRIELYPEFRAVGFIKEKELSDRIYNDASIRNFTLPYMLVYLRFMQNNLVKQASPSVYAEYTDNNLRSRLAKDTLYIPENVVYNRSGFTGKESKKEENFFESYKGRYKVLSTKEMVELIKNRNPTKPLFLFEYVLSSSQKFVGVLEVNSGTVVYRRYTTATYNLKAKDMEKIVL